MKRRRRCAWGAWARAAPPAIPATEFRLLLPLVGVMTFERFTSFPVLSTMTQTSMAGDLLSQDRPARLTDKPESSAGCGAGTGCAARGACGEARRTGSWLPQQPLSLSLLLTLLCSFRRTLSPPYCTGLVP